MPSPDADAANVFGDYATSYAARRPGYPDAVFDALDRALEGRRSLALELGAGSGQATRALAARFERVIAIEPDARMARAMPAIDNAAVIVSSAELAGFSPGCADAVVAATAFHWMDQQRVARNAFHWLRSGGVFFPFLYDVIRIDGAAGDMMKLLESDWAPFKDRRLLDSVDYLSAVASAGLFSSIKPFARELSSVVPAAYVARLLGTASFVNAYVRAAGIDIADYVDELSREFAAIAEEHVIRVPLTGVLAIK